MHHYNANLSLFERDIHTKAVFKDVDDNASLTYSRNEDFSPNTSPAEVEKSIPSFVSDTKDKVASKHANKP